MRSPSPRLLLIALASTAWSLRASAAEPSPHVHYAALSAELDDAESDNLHGELNLPLGRKGWVHLGLGSSTASIAQERIDSTFATIGIGLDTQRWELDAGHTYRKDSDSFEQHDLRGGARLRMPRVSLGVDLFYRTAEDETVTSVERRRLDPLQIRTVESIEGKGIGLNGSVDATARLRLFAAAMKYDYDIDVDAPAFLARLPRLSLRISGVTREEAYLDNTMHVGASYDFDRCSLTVRYTRDEVIDASQIIDTFDLTADIPVAERWALAPWIGRSSDDVLGDVAFAGLHVSVVW
jgi:hypothetical protein